MPKFIPVEQYSWVWHPFYGTFTASGYMQHRKIEWNHPEILKLPVIENGEEILLDYDPPRGYVLVEQGLIKYARYDQSKYVIKGTKDKAPKAAIDELVRKTYKLDPRLPTVFLEPVWWY